MSLEIIFDDDFYNNFSIQSELPVVNSHITKEESKEESLPFRYLLIAGYLSLSSFRAYMNSQLNSSIDKLNYLQIKNKEITENLYDNLNKIKGVKEVSTELKREHCSSIQNKLLNIMKHDDIENIKYYNSLELELKECYDKIIKV